MRILELVVVCVRVCARACLAAGDSEISEEQLSRIGTEGGRELVRELPLEATSWESEAPLSHNFY